MHVLMETPKTRVPQLPIVLVRMTQIAIVPILVLDIALGIVCAHTGKNVSCSTIYLEVQYAAQRIELMRVVINSKALK